MANDADVPEQFMKTPMAMQNAFCRIRIPGEARQVLDNIIRKTIGWRKTKDKISISQLCMMTGIKRPNVIRSVKRLEDMRIIVSDRAERITAYEINVAYEEWRQDKPKHKTGIRNDTNQSGIRNDTDTAFKVVSETIPKVVSETILDSIKNDTETGIINDTHNRKKDTFLKEKKESRKKVYAFSNCFDEVDFLKTATDFCEERKNVAPNAKLESLNDVAKILSSLGESPDELSRAIAWTQSHTPYWKSRILSAESFASSYENIKLEMAQEENELFDDEPEIEF